MTPPTNSSPTSGSTPLLKWPGGKRALLPELKRYVPASYGRYFEPFFGGGALFFDIRPADAVLSDTNAELIECYQVVRDQPDELVARLRKFKNTKAAYL